MTIETLTCYRTSDGKLHTDKQWAEEHEESLMLSEKATKLLADGGSLYDALSLGDKYNRLGRLTEHDQVLLKSTAKDTLIAIPHWQCRDEPLYKAERIDFVKGIGVYFYGGKPLSWSGNYGNWVNLDDTVRYLENTFKEKMNEH